MRIYSILSSVSCGCVQDLPLVSTSSTFSREYQRYVIISLIQNVHVVLQIHKKKTIYIYLASCEKPICNQIPGISDKHGNITQG